MPRHAREDCGSDIYHVGLKGNNSQNLFYDDEDRLKFLQVLFRACEEYEVGLAAWVLMDNHTHFLMHGNIDVLCRLFKSVGPSYVQWFHGKYSDSGRFFAERFYSKGIVGCEQYCKVVAYIFNNPIRAKMVTSAKDYEWTNCNDVMLGYDDEAISLMNRVVNVEEVIQLTMQQVECANDDFLQVFPRRRMTDAKLIEELRDIISAKEIKNLSSFPAETQAKVVQKALELGGNMNQVARITGLSRRKIAMLRSVQ